MYSLRINAVKVGLVACFFLVLWFVVRSVARHLAAFPPAPRTTAPTSPPGSPAVAISDRSGARTRRVEVRGPLVVGRGEEADVVIDDPFASQRHLLLDVDAGRLAVEDLGSATGTLVNDVVIHQRTVVGGGDRIRVGTTTLEVT